ncbi:MAG: polyhydroxyalkanoic acid system family protein [Oligoflexia bacterium]|nr:polyhydroxyalkanoic acid system family protein [Oligoflexia bacterium]
MPNFKVEHQSPLPPDETFNKVCDYLQNSEGIKKLDNSLKFDLNPPLRKGHVKGSKFECEISVSGQTPSQVVLSITIPLLLSPFKSSIENTIKEKMAKILG